MKRKYVWRLEIGFKLRGDVEVYYCEGSNLRDVIAELEEFPYETVYVELSQVHVLD